MAFLKTTTEALTGETRHSPKAAKRLRSISLERLRGWRGTRRGDLLWSPNEPQYVRSWSTGSALLPALEHWYMALPDAHNDVAPALGAPTLVYEQAGSAYSGPLCEVGDRVLRKAIAVELGAIRHGGGGSLERHWRRRVAYELSPNDARLMPLRSRPRCGASSPARGNSIGHEALAVPAKGTQGSAVP